MFALVDCNSFYASCEQLFNPKLRNKPVIVLSNNDGCVIARSKEAKQIGIKMGEPVFKIKAVIETYDVAVYSANFALYGDLSRRVTQVLKGFSPNVEIYSIDEAFLDLTGLKELNEYGQTIRARVLKWVGIATCVGIGQTKTLAKVANHLAKKKDQYNGVCVLETETEIETALNSFPIEDIWGIGRQYSKLLQKHGITTALQFRNLPPDFVKSRMSVVGLRTQKELKGISCFALEEILPPKKAILTSRSFGQSVTELNDLRQSVAVFAASCAEKLRRQNCSAAVVRVFVHTNPHRADETQYHVGREITLSTPSDLSNEIIKHALIALKAIYRPGLRYKKAGVMVMGIVPNNAVQSSLFDPLDRTKQKKIAVVLDNINHRYGRSTVRFGVESGKRKWKMRQQTLSKRFTTNFNELLEVG